MARQGSGVIQARPPRNVPLLRRSFAAVLLAVVVLLADLVGGAGATPAGAQEVKPPLTVDGPGPCRRIGGDWLPPGYCELTGPLRVGPDDSLVLAVGAFLLGPVDVEGRLEVQGAASLVFFFGELANRGQLAVTDAGVIYVAGTAESPGAVDLSGGGRMEILSDSGALTTTGRFDVAADGRLDVYGAWHNQGRTTNLGVVAVWCSGSLVGPPPLGVAAQVQDCRPPEVSLVSRTPADASGWNRGTVTVVWACTDEGSGVVTERVTAVLSGDGAEQSAFGVCTDLAGNTAAGVVTGINIERPAPKTRRRPAPPVVVHLEPAAPAPPPPAPPPPGPLPSASPEVALPGPTLTDPVSSPDPAPAPVDPTATPVTASASTTATTSTAPATSVSADGSGGSIVAPPTGPSTLVPPPPVPVPVPSTSAATTSSATTTAPTTMAPTTTAPTSTTGTTATATSTTAATTPSATTPSAPTGVAAATGATAGGVAITTTTTLAVTSAASPTAPSSTPPPVTDQAPVPTTVATTPTGAASGPAAGPPKTLRHRPIRHPRRTGGSAPPG